jgi:hypothetical protein
MSTIGLCGPAPAATCNRAKASASVSRVHSSCRLTLRRPTFAPQTRVTAIRWASFTAPKWRMSTVMSVCPASERLLHLPRRPPPRSCRASVLGSRLPGWLRSRQCDARPPRRGVRLPVRCRAWWLARLSGRRPRRLVLGAWALCEMPLLRARRLIRHPDPPAEEGRPQGDGLTVPAQL